MIPPTNGYQHIPSSPGVPQQVPPSPAVPQPTPAAQPLFPTAIDEDAPWARQSTGREPLTGRNRRHLRSLPSWDPQPPGEIFVQRRHRVD